MSCNDWLNENDYTYAIATSTFYNTKDEANAAVMSPLNQMRVAYDANWFATLEINTEYCYPKGVYQTYRGYNGLVNATHITRSATNWSAIYRAVLYCNTAIGKLPEAKAMTEAEIKSYLGELRFLRAYNYFSLVLHWGSVPLRTETNMTEWNLKKTSVREIYDFIIEDLKYAIDNAPDIPRLIGTPHKLAAKALLADVCMWTEDYDQAKALAGDVINSGTYSLVNVSNVRDFDKVFGYDLATSTEEVFYIKTSRTDSRTWNYLSFTAHPQYSIEGKTMLNGNGYYTHYSDLRNQVIANWDETDLRYHLNLGFYVFGADAYGEYTCLFVKYWDPYSQGGGANVSIPLIRYTDVLITYAEASARVAGAPTAESVEMLNRLRRRGYGHDPDVANPELDYKPADCNTMEKFIDLLIKEETYERMNEGKHWDLTVRLKKAQELVGKYYNVDGAWTEIKERHYLWKIPDSEFNYNKALDQKTDQNPGYSSDN
jgi:hypothetical protein